jgi:hypothetical protein
MDLKDTFIGRARKYNHFQDSGQEIAARSCLNCIRKQFSFPYTCDEGWDNYRARQEAKGARCLNWTDRGDAPVD